MTTVGISMETTFFNIIEKMFLVLQQPFLDRLKIDGLVVGIKLDDRLLRLTEILVMQVTTRIGDMEKRLLFFDEMRRHNITKIAFVEIDVDEIDAMFPQITKAALLSLFFDEKVPRRALICLGKKYSIVDLDKAIESHKAWLETLIPGEIYGQMIFWKWRENQIWKNGVPENREDFEDITASISEAREGFGFVEPVDNKIGPNNSRGIFKFFVSSREIDSRLQEKLNDLDGDISEENILVFFQDAGCRKRYSRKTAKDVVLCDPEDEQYLQKFEKAFNIQQNR